MKKVLTILVLIISGISFVSCNNIEKEEIKAKRTNEQPNQMMKINDERISLNLNPMQKQHQLKNMRSHLEAVNQIIILLSDENYDEASEVAYKELGSTTEMKLMCASFGDKGFENLGLEFHKSADKMSEIFKEKNKDKSLKSLSKTMNYCIQCHSTYRQ